MASPEILSIQSRRYPKSEIAEVITSLQQGDPVPPKLAAKYGRFELQHDQLKYGQKTLVAEEDQNQVIAGAYEKTFAGVNRLHAYIMTQHVGVKQRKVAAWLARSPVQQQHRRQPSLSSTKPRIVRDLNSVWQMDVMYFRTVPILVVVDLWSKFARVALLRNRDAKAVRNALETMFLQMKPRALSCDNGSEFRGVVQKMLKHQGISQVFGHPGQPTSQASAERFIRTIRMTLERYRTSGGSNWRKFLFEWTATYNTVKHLSIGFPPSALQHPTQCMKQSLATKRAIQVTKLLNKRRTVSFPTLFLGDLVRTKILRKSGLEKKSRTQYSKETHQVTRILQSKYMFDQYQLNNNKVYQRDHLLKIPEETIQTTF
eukprot:Lithocolla_globosa_v1_NODE_195_length_5267_cov_27.182464.p1 type:complete len:372 gc:universal NODE_195_length_5267_cov_27.182464:1386-271(-)